MEAFPLCELRQSHYRIVLVHFVIAGGRVVSAMENHPLVRAGLTSMREMHNFGLCHARVGGRAGCSPTRFVLVYVRTVRVGVRRCCCKLRIVGEREKPSGIVRPDGVLTALVREFFCGWHATRHGAMPMRGAAVRGPAHDLGAMPEGPGPAGGQPW